MKLRQPMAPSPTTKRVGGRRGVEEGRAHSRDACQMEHVGGRTDQSIELCAIGDAPRDNAYVGKLRAEILLVPALFRGGIGLVAEVIENRDGLPARQKRTRDVVANETNSACDQPATQGRSLVHWIIPRSNTTARNTARQPRHGLLAGFSIDAPLSRPLGRGSGCDRHDQQTGGESPDLGP